MLNDQFFPLRQNCRSVREERIELLDIGDFSLRLSGRESQPAIECRTCCDGPKLVQALWNNARRVPVLPDGVGCSQAVLIEKGCGVYAEKKNVRVKKDEHYFLAVFVNALATHIFKSESGRI